MANQNIEYDLGIGGDSYKWSQEVTKPVGQPSTRVTQKDKGCQTGLKLKEYYLKLSLQDCGQL